MYWFFCTKKKFCHLHHNHKVVISVGFTNRRWHCSVILWPNISTTGSSLANDTNTSIWRPLSFEANTSTLCNLSFEVINLGSSPLWGNTCSLGHFSFGTNTSTLVILHLMQTYQCTVHFIRAPSKTWTYKYHQTKLTNYTSPQFTTSKP